MTKTKKNTQKIDSTDGSVSISILLEKIDLLKQQVAERDAQIEALQEKMRPCCACISADEPIAEEAEAAAYTLDDAGADIEAITEYVGKMAESVASELAAADSRLRRLEELQANTARAVSQLAARCEAKPGLKYIFRSI